MKFPLTDLLEVLTVGIPFCGFKVLSGVVFWNSPFMPAHLFGALLVGLAAADLAINAGNAAGLAFARRRPLPVCLLNAVLHPEWTWHDLGNSLDVLLSFTLVAIVIGGGLLRQLTPAQISAWDVCVVFNVMGAGLSRFGSSVAAAKKSRAK